MRVSGGDSFTSIGNLKCLPTSARDLGIFVSLIGVVFHAYCDVFEFSTNEEWVPMSAPMIVYVLFRNLWYLLTLLPL